VNYWVSVVVLPNTAQEQPCLDFWNRDRVL
jgi:hypothetical protein